MLRIAPAHPPESARARSLWSNLVAGFGYLARNRLVLLLLLFGLLPMFLAMPFQQLLPAFAEKVWPVGSNGLGLLSAMVGLGGIAGSLPVAGRGGVGWGPRVRLGCLVGFFAQRAAFG